MAKKNLPFPLITLSVLGGLVVASWSMQADQISVKAQAADEATIDQRPVDDDMHHFMEYVFEPNYKRLKAAMAAKPKDGAAWKAIKGDALTLAECTNLLLLRAPEQDAAPWRQLSVTVRTHGGELYQAARKSDYATARKAYVEMLGSCNACHDKFAEGEHQLSP